ncbi:MAG: LPXTG cell wall anchor domain-containing protein, partial [Anaerolineae bacterium]
MDLELIVAAVVVGLAMLLGVAIYFAARRRKERPVQTAGTPPREVAEQQRAEAADQPATPAESKPQHPEPAAAMPRL